jgi:hypothetical protein
MKVSLKGRAIAIGVAAGSLLAVPLAMPVSASVAQPASCAAIKTVKSGKSININVSKCLPVAATGGSGTGKTSSGTGALKGTTINKITWAKGKGTTTTSIKYGPAKGNGKCKVGTTRLAITGKVVKSTGTAANTIKANQKVTASVCVNATTAATTIEPGTKFLM